jgi:CDP-glucose 4,6-dehydratase
VEGLEVTEFGGIYGQRRVLVTGHTGFKGSWLTLWLDALGAQITGIAIEPDTTPSHWDLLRLSVDDRRVDVRDASAVREVVREAAPEIVFHLAAQSLVRRSYREPLETWSTNVMGTAHVLEACRQQRGVRAIIVVTSDKCYENQEGEWSYREIDRLGGYDAYSASKAAAELVVSSYRRAFFGQQESPLLASARAGNVIGGGDWCEDRLIPDVARAIARGTSLEIRSPYATRPWQHVMEPLSGYLLLGQRLLEGRREFADAWNFGPGTDSNLTVNELLILLRAEWPALEWQVARDSQHHEAHSLQLDSAKARWRLGWQSTWSIGEAVKATAVWYRGHTEQGVLSSLDQLRAYTAAAHRAGMQWCVP